MILIQISLLTPLRRGKVADTIFLCSYNRNMEQFNGLVQ